MSYKVNRILKEKTIHKKQRNFLYDLIYKQIIL